MRRLVAVMIVALAVLAVAGARSLTTASAGGGEDFTLTETVESETFINNGDDAEGAGDELVFKESSPTTATRMSATT